MKFLEIQIKNIPKNKKLPETNKKNNTNQKGKKKNCKYVFWKKKRLNNGG